jgi:signal transduction histidine kinase
MRTRLLQMRRVFDSVWADGAVAVALLVLGQVEVWGGATYQGGPVFPGPRLANALAVVPLLALPLALRRRAPLVSFALVLGTVAWASLAFGGAEATTEFVAALVAVYSATANGDRRYVVLGGALIAGAVHELRDPHVHGIGDVVWGAGLLAVAWLFGIAVRGRHGKIANLEGETARLTAEQEQRAREAVAAERSRIARELHDVAAHAVSVVVVQAQAGQRLVGRDDPSARASLEAIEDTARTALQEMRRLLGMLRDTDAASLAPQPGLAQLDELARQVSDAGLPVEVEVDGAPTPLAAGIDLAAYRLVQEGLTNALKHAGAARASVRIRYSDTQVELEVADDGRGRNGAAGASGHGLVGLRERVALYGGTFESGPAHEGGWRLSATLPLEERD